MWESQVLNLFLSVVGGPERQINIQMMWAIRISELLPHLASINAPIQCQAWIAYLLRCYCKLGIE